MKAETIARALGGRKAGGGWIAHCPAHDDRKPSLSIHHGDDGKILVCCHAGCGQTHLIAALRSRGLWGQNRNGLFPSSSSRAAAYKPPDPDAAKRSAAGFAVWNASSPAAGTLVETYLASRRLKVLPPPRLRFHPGLKHASGRIWPAMVALVTRGADDIPIGIHRTFLARNGIGKAPVDPQKMMLGPCRGGAVRLGAPGDVLMVGERVASLPSWRPTIPSGQRSQPPDCEYSICRVLCGR